MKNTLYTYIILLLSITGAVLPLSAQNSSMNKAESLMSQGEYSAALEELSHVSSSDARTADYYRVICHMKISPASATSHVDDFLTKYPASPYRTEIITSMADALWEGGDYVSARRYYDMTDKFSISSQTDRNRFAYRKAYCAYATGDCTSARKDMYSLIDDPSYGTDATYIYAHICYMEGDASICAEYLERIKDVPRYKTKAASYLSGIYLTTGQWDKSIEASLSYLSAGQDGEDAAVVRKNLAMAYFNAGEYEKCISALQETLKSSVPSQQELYMLGYSHYKCGRYMEAASYLSPLTEKKCDHTQQAFYILGDIYLKSQEKTKALNAYRSAIQEDTDPQITANSWYNYAMLSYETGNPYMSVSDVMREYLKRYPASPHAPQVYDYLTDSFLSSHEYQEAVDCIESMGLTSEKSREALQKASYFLAAQKLNARDYDAAIKYYLKSIEQDYDPALTAESYFWAGETYIRMGMYDEALRMYESFSSHPMSSSTAEWAAKDYQLGYLYAERGDYSSAMRCFSSYLKKDITAEQTADTHMRIADCQFALGQYKQALSSYTKALSGKDVPRDYIAYQRTLCMGIQGDYSQQVKALGAFLDTYQESSLRASARYDLGMAYQRLNRNDDAINAFLSVEKENASTDMTAQGKSRAAAAYYNAGESEKALALYKEIVEKYPSSPVTPLSMRWARQISVENGQSDEFIAWNSRINSTPIDMMSMDSLQWETARKFYTQQDYPAAITHLTRYTEKYPSGLFLPDVLFARGQSYLCVGDTASAKADFRTLCSQQGGKHTESSLVKYTDIMIKSDSAYHCLSQLEQLYETAAHEENKKYAAINALGVYMDEEDWDGVKRYADIIRQNYKTDTHLYADASVALYEAYVEGEEYEKAALLTDDVMGVAADENMARALYYLSRIQYESKDYDASISTITRLCSEYSMYKYTGGRALLLLAQNYYAKGDTYQAGYILENVINSTSYDDIRSEAKIINEYIKSKNDNK